MVKSINAKMRNQEIKKGKPDEKRSNPRRGKHGCSRLKALNPVDPVEEEKKPIIARLRFWK